ncbi:unnamed protein product [Clonostachys rosea f. rosea IK726]|uniref:Uncharacterized protein n=1 Tax=Clonostachys rosea f. rosea IK726 TaxID=1349383 RepID=A0ACA9TDS8_BIOOC|nr:unnamed protein product [Clonostachys rosea f. rosea IK726]
MSPSQVLDGANRQVFLGTFVHSKSRAELEYMHDTAIYVDEHGVIVKVQTSGSDTVEETLEDLGWDAASVDRHVSTDGQFFFPGLIDTHVHASQYPNVGIFGKTTLLDWLEKYTFPLESSLKDLNKARRVYSACVRRTLAHGTTTAAYYATTDVAATNLLADLCLKMGQRAFVGRVSMDNPDLCPDYYRDESAQASAELTEQTIQHIQNADPGYEIVSPIVTPRFAPSQAALVSRHVAMGEEGGDGHKLTVDEVLYLATRGGAICVGLEDKIGGFEEGKHWDAQLIGMRTVGSGEGEDGEREDESEDSNVDLFGWEDWEERMAKWLYGGDDRNTKKVWVKGRLVHSRRGSDRQTK